MTSDKWRARTARTTGSTVFLRDPSEIREAVTNLQKNGKSLDLAVAFVGADWQEMLSECKDHIRVICWLSSTNPHAVQDMMERPGTEVRQRDGMHCKVYLSPRTGAVVGSANLSKAALAKDGNSGQDEAAVLVTAPSLIRDIREWFERMWSDQGTRPITSCDLERAIERWSLARRARRPDAVESSSETHEVLKVSTEQERPICAPLVEETLTVLQRLLRDVEPQMDFVYDPTKLDYYMNVRENGRLLVPNRPGSYAQPIRLYFNPQSIKITALSKASVDVREQAERKLRLAGFKRAKPSKKSDENQAVRVGEVVKSKLEAPLAQDAIRNLFAKSIEEWRKRLVS